MTVARAARFDAPNLSESTLESLYASGLTDETIALSRISDATSNPLIQELLSKYRAADGYHIPYPELDGSFGDKAPYRLRILAPVDMPKYLQPAKSGNHIYIPPFGLAKGWQDDIALPLFITEGEKKALAGMQAGIPTLAVGGVYSWRSQTFKLPRADVQMTDTGESRMVSVNASHAKLMTERVAPELLEISWQDRTVYLVFDSDASQKVQVQQACVDLALWLNERGANVLQVNLPDDEDGGKMGMDDFLVRYTAESSFLNEEWLRTNSSEPLPLDVKKYLADMLNGNRVTRQLSEKVARIALNALNAWGERYTDGAGGYFYFDGGTSQLHEFRMDLPRLRESSFGQLVRTEFGLATNDASVLSRLADDFVVGATTVTPRRVVGTSGDAVYFQLSDSRVARVTADGVDLVDNGTDDMLFLSGEVEQVDEARLAKAIKRGREKPRWLTAIESVNLEPLSPLNLKQTRELLTTLFYLSPWLFRWRGTMLPLEVCVAEPNSGKTFLYNLRRGILTGRPGLNGLPDDFKGWASAVGSTGGIWVCDNLGSIRSDYWHRFADEIARLTTEPDPSIDLRQLYTTSTVHSIPVQCSFAITTIKNPFTQPDILQRSLVYNLRAIPVDARDSGWYTRALGEREEWLADHLTALSEFFKLVGTKWNDRYLSGFRLVNFEQALLLMGRVLGFNMQSVIAELPAVVAGAVAEFDPVVEALVAFVEAWPKATARLRDVVNWVENDEDRRFVNIKTMDNLVVLGRYVRAHAYDIEQATGCKLTRPNNVLTLVMPTGEEDEE